MKVRIGVAESNKVVELEIDDLAAFKKEVAAAVESGDVFWVSDIKGREVGIPASRLVYVEAEPKNADVAVGFVPGA